MNDLCISQVVSALINEKYENSNHAFGFLSLDDNKANEFLLHNIRKQIFSGENVLVFCLDTERVLTAIKYSKNAKGDLTIREIPFEEHIPENINQILCNNMDTINFSAIYILHYANDELMPSFLSEYEKMATNLQIPIFVAIQDIGIKNIISSNLFTIKRKTEPYMLSAMNEIYEIEFSESNSKGLFLYDIGLNQFKEII